MFTIMPPLRLRTTICIIMAILFVCLIAGPQSKSHFNDIHPPTVNSLHGWGVAEQIFVISLPNRTDRRAALSPLWKAHRLKSIQYINATSVGEPEIDRILSHVRKERRRQRAYQNDGKKRRPSFTDGLGKYPGELWGSDLWTLGSTLPEEDLLDPDAAYPIPCERGNPFNPHRVVPGGHYAAAPTETIIRKVPLLSRPMVACWHSHLQVIRQISMLGSTTEQPGVNHLNPKTYIVIEDDVDFEWNIKNFLSPIWDALPSDWEVVMLGQFHLGHPHSCFEVDAAKVTAGPMSVTIRLYSN
jgi:hypothetical protein